MSVPFDLLLWPFAVGVLVLATHVPLGRRVLARGIIFLDLAVAQFAVLGVVAAHALELAAAGWPTQLAAAAAALAGAALLAACERRWPEIQEALIGASFVVAASLAVLLLAHDPHGGEHLAGLMSGQVLWATPAQAAQLAVLTVMLGTVLAWRGERLGRLGFYLVFALAITASVQLVGVYLVFASLILPALALRGLPARAALPAGWAVGAFAYAAGLFVSAAGDWPAGPAIVVALALGAAVLGLARRFAVICQQVAAKGRRR
ncbi:MAG: metal ABC transporter permease [Thiobacillus sp.]